MKYWNIRGVRFDKAIHRPKNLVNIHYGVYNQYVVISFNKKSNMIRIPGYIPLALSTIKIEGWAKKLGVKVLIEVDPLTILWIR